MFGSEILDVAIGLILVYLLLSLICSAIREGLESLTKMRAVGLERGIRELLQDLQGNGLAKSLYTHPLIYGLFIGEYDASKIKRKNGQYGLMGAGSNLPSYIPAGNFAVALLDIVARGAEIKDNVAATPAAAPISVENIRTALTNFQNAPVQRALLAAIDTAQGDLAKAQANIEAWYNSAMERVSGWYKRRTQWILFAVGLFLTFAINVNTIAIANHLYQNRAAREAIVAEAQVVARDPDRPAADVRELYADLDRLALPIGWADGWPGPPWRASKDEPLRTIFGVDVPPWGWIWGTLFAPILGWLMTAFALTLGAPFWFDMLNKFILIRSTVKPREDRPTEGSGDRQGPAGLGAQSSGASNPRPAT